MERVLRMVGLNQYLDGGRNLLGERIKPGASNFSNGERQRLAIARVLLCKPRILILDETTSSLDPSSEEAILRTIARALSDSTLIIVTHRLRSVSWMRRILVMQEGQIVGDGNHAILSATNHVYMQLLASPIAVG